MSSYEDITRQIGDQWVAALKQAEDSVAALAQGIQDATAGLNLPEMPVSGPVSALAESVSDKLPKPVEIVEANYELTHRLLSAQRDLTLRILEVSGGAAAAR